MTPLPLQWQGSFSPDGRHVAYARLRWYPDQPFYEASEIMVVEVR